MEGLLWLSYIGKNIWCYQCTYFFFQIQIARVIHQVYKANLREITLMTPYRAQKDCLKQLANEAGLLNAEGLTVTTITESQGTFLMEAKFSALE